jgi:hypothetical protein
LVFPVGEVMAPIVMLPWVEFEARQTGIVLLPSVASIAGSSTPADRSCYFPAFAAMS